MTNSSQNFWNFSVQLYSSDEVANACLQLQNNHGLDVNMLLLCTWYGQYYGLLSDSSLEEALAFSSRWRSHVVQPLRNTRQWMKNHPPTIETQQSEFGALREQIKKAELKAENHQQNALEKIVSSSETGKEEEIEGKENGFEAIQKNIQALLGELDITDSVELSTALSVITQAAGRL